MFVIQILRLLPASDYKLDFSVVLCAQSESSGCLKELFVCLVNVLSEVLFVFFQSMMGPIYLSNNLKILDHVL